MARNRWLLAAGAICAWLSVATLTTAQLIETPRVKVQGRDLIDDTQAPPPSDDNPFGGEATKSARTGDDPFGSDAAEPSKPDDKTLIKPPKGKTIVLGVNRAGEIVQPGAVHVLRVGSDTKVRQVLQEPTQMEFTEMPLQDAVAFLKDFHGIEIQLDTRAMETAGVGTDTPVTRTVKGISLAAGLRLLLGEYDLTYVVRDGMLLITTQAASRQMLELRVYDIEKILGREIKADEVAVLVMQLEQPQMMGGMGGGFPMPPSTTQVRVVPFRNLLVVRASAPEHEMFLELFGELRAMLGAEDVARETQH